MFDLSSITNGTIWITADLHLGHAAILEHTKRPWKNIDRHDNALIKNACELVKPDDLYIIDGDLTMYGSERSNFVRSVLNRLPGKKILVFGNHDKVKALKYVDLGCLLATTSLVLPGDVLVAHDPAWAQTWPQDKPMLCGHIHELFKVCRNVVNVGVDVWDYKPIKLEGAISIARQSIKTIDETKEVNWKMVSKKRHRLEDVD